VPSTGRIGAIKVMSLASSYWHGDENSDRLTRVYGTAFFSKKDLDKHLHALEEAKQRDHRVLGQAARPVPHRRGGRAGADPVDARGAIVRKELQTSSRRAAEAGVQVFTPHIGKLGLYKTRGHFPYYQESQFPPGGGA
jgi:threonyl-tRNA synthetase